MEQKRLTFKPANPANRAFFGTLRKRVDQYFKDNNISKHANPAMVTKTISLLLITFGVYGLIISGILPKWGMLIGAVVMGFGIAGIGFSIAHDALHNAYSSNNKVNKLLGLTMDLIGSNSYTWHLKHNLAHHTYTNIHDYDEDIKGAAVIRFSPFAPYKKFHRFQHIYGFLLYSLVYINILLVYNFQRFIESGFGPFRNLKHPRKEWIKLIGFKLLFFFYTIAIPLMVLDISVGEFILGYLAMCVTTGLTLGLIFNLAHVVENLDYPLPDVEKANMEEAWAIHQLRTTANFAPKNKFLTWYIGGLNYQIEHHLFPGVCSIHYPKLAKIVEQTATEFGVPYVTYKTLGKSLNSHYKMLRTLGQENAHEMFGKYGGQVKAA